MKKTSPIKSKRKDADEMKREYRFDYSAAKPNRFAGRIRKGSVAVLLDPDVAKLFEDAESVNAVLRALMATMPARRVSARKQTFRTLPRTTPVLPAPSGRHFPAMPLHVH